MLNETRLALRISTTAYDAELVSLIRAGYKDLQLAGIRLPGAVSFSQNATTGEWTDTSSLKDELCVRAVITYVRVHFGSPADYDRVLDSYETQKCQLMHSHLYTNYNGGECE